MIRICGPGKVCLVAAVAGGGRVDVVVVYVALQARDCGVGACERVVGIERMVEFRIEPVNGRVACRAIVRKTKLHMRRIVCAGEIVGVAGVTGSRRTLEDIVGVACGAGQRRMCSGQRIAGECKVIELCVEPGVDCMASLAIGGEAC